MTRGYLRLLPGLRDSASMIGAKSVPALASTYSTPRSARRERKDSAVMRAALSVTEFPRFIGGQADGSCTIVHAAALSTRGGGIIVFSTSSKIIRCGELGHNRKTDRKP